MSVRPFRGSYGSTKLINTRRADSPISDCLPLAIDFEPRWIRQHTQSLACAHCGIPHHGAWERLLWQRDAYGVLRSGQDLHRQSGGQDVGEKGVERLSRVRCVGGGVVSVTFLRSRLSV